MLVLLSLILLWLDPPVEPLRFLQTAISQHRIVFLGDIHPVAEPKLLVTQLIASQREDQAIDLLALEVASEQQEWIDQYLASQPEDVSILGFDDVPEAAYLSPPLTTVRQDFAALGGLIMQKVLIAVEEPDTATESTPLATTLQIRQSTRPLPR